MSEGDDSVVCDIDDENVDLISSHDLEFFLGWNDGPFPFVASSPTIVFFWSAPLCRRRSVSFVVVFREWKPFFEVETDTLFYVCGWQIVLSVFSLAFMMILNSDENPRMIA